MADRSILSTGILDTDAQALFREGLQWYGRIGMVQNWTGLNSVILKYGVELKYEESLSDKDAAMLRKILGSAHPVRKLSLSEISLSAFKAAFHNPDKCPSLREVHVGFIDCHRKTLDLTECGVLQSVCSLHLGSDNTGPAFADDVASYIRQNESLRELSISHSCGGDRGVATLVEALRTNDTLKRFSLGDMELSSDTLVIFATMLTSNFALELVNLTNTFPVEEDKVLFVAEDEFYAGVFQRLQIQWPERLLPDLTDLLSKEEGCPLLSVVVTNSASIPVVWKFFLALSEVKTLRELYLNAGDDISSAFTVGIVRVFMLTTTLRVVAISTCVRAEKGHYLTRMLQALRTNRSVTKFKIEASALTPQIATSLSELLAVNSTLNQVTILAYRTMSPAESETIVNALKSNYILTRLDVDCGCDDSDGRREMRTLLKRNIYPREQGCGVCYFGCGR
ncbi:hypothetical protein HPB50_011333 [Hyalomma asiaticum]|uniref:Uncharacterized protein n=1 Tax=Hyalomma asiaticum TaxID=266040 RepID=A0ACB7RIA2_HYAAI|nr:hypothetical protein HPB50_011333 [Hyalomma asiaticum]